MFRISSFELEPRNYFFEQNNFDCKSSPDFRIVSVRCAEKRKLVDRRKCSIYRLSKRAIVSLWKYYSVEPEIPEQDVNWLVSRLSVVSNTSLCVV